MGRRHEPDPFALKLGGRIRDLRLAQGMSLEHLRRKTGVVASHLSLIERGDIAINVGTLDRIAGALGLTPMFLVLFPEESELEAVVEQIGSMSAEEPAQLREQVSASSPRAEKPRPSRGTRRT